MSRLSRIYSTFAKLRPAIDGEVSAESALFLSSLTETKVLRSRQEMSLANVLVESLGLPAHHDIQKNWDSLKSFLAILKDVSPDGSVLDAGSGSRAVIAKWLQLYGYKNLYACDIEDHSAQFTSGIKFSVQNLEKTNYGSGQFKAIVSISVIEHGLNLKAFAEEVSRILMPGGIVVLSTDFWSAPIDCSGIYPYGEAMGQMKIFNPSDMQAFCSVMADVGLELVGNLDLHTHEKCVRWERVNRDYTFLFLSFRKK